MMNKKYVPLYRKYRPQTIDELVGQEHIKSALKNSIQLNKISHAYLFTGPRGTGKTSTARIFAKSLNCKNGPTITPCGECECCKDISNSIPMDVIEIDAASNRTVEDAENLLEKVQYAPIYGKYKIYIIDEVHMLSPHAFNALLKTLEEPPENVIFILATTEVHKVLDTIKSRCQRFDFRRITTDDIVKHLRYISNNEKINITDDALYTIAKNSAGGMRDSIGLLDQVSILGIKDTIDTDTINKLLGRISFDILSKISQTIIDSKPEIAIEFLNDIYNAGNEPTQILTNLLDYLKNLLIAKNCKDELLNELTQLNAEQIKILKEQTNDVETQQIVALIDKCCAYIKELKITNNPRLWIEVAIIDLANLTENTTLADLQNRISQLEGNEVTVHNTSAYKTPPLPVAKPEIINQVTKPEIKIDKTNTTDNKSANETKITVETETDKQEIEFSPMPNAKNNDNDIATLWATLLTNIPMPTNSLLKQCANPVKISTEEVIIGFNTEIWLKKFQDSNKLTLLTDAVNKLFNQGNSNVIIRVLTPEDKKILEKKNPQPKILTVPSQPIEVSDEPTQEEIKELSKISQNKNPEAFLHSDLTNNIVDLFDGKIIE